MKDGEAIDNAVGYDDTYLVIHQAESGYVVKVCAKTGPAKLHAFSTPAQVIEFVAAHKFRAAPIGPGSVTVYP